LPPRSARVALVVVDSSTVRDVVTPSRPVVSPTYAQGSCYWTNRVVVSAPGRFTGPAAPFLSTTRAARPSGRDRRRSRSSIARTGRVSRKNGTRGAVRGLLIGSLPTTCPGYARSSPDVA